MRAFDEVQTGRGAMPLRSRKRLPLLMQILFELLVLLSFPGCSHKKCAVDTSELEKEFVEIRISYENAKAKIVRDNIDDCDKIIIEVNAYRDMNDRTVNKRLKEILEEMESKYSSQAEHSKCNVSLSMLFAFERMNATIKSSITQYARNFFKEMDKKCPHKFYEIIRVAKPSI